MTVSRSGRERFAIGFMVVWIVFWAAGMLIVLYGFGTALLGGNFAAAGFMLIWLAAAGFGLFMGARKLVQILRHERPEPEGARAHEWNDDTAI